MIWAVTDIAFLAAMLIVIALFYVLTGRANVIAERLTRLWKPAESEALLSFRERQKARLEALLNHLSKFLPSPKKHSLKAQQLLTRAGFHRPEILNMVRGAKLISISACLSVVYFTDLYLQNPILFLATAAMLGYLLPDMWLSWRARKRQHAIQLGLADGLDLLVICVEAGLALDQALVRVAQEMRIVHPELSEEIALLSAEIRLGKTRTEALRALGTRTGVEDIKSLVAMLIQTDRFGTSIAQSLRVYSENLRSKRRQRAEEAAAKTTVKMVPALVFFIFPALFVVILGPAVIAVFRQFIQQ